MHVPLSPLDNILPQWLPLLDSASPSLSDSSSSVYTDSSPTPPPGAIRAVCNVPLIAPRPLPYHSPTFLQFDLPDTDEDLSHPPYTHRPSKRKRDTDDEPPLPQPQSKRRPATHRRISRPVHRPRDHPSAAHLPHRSDNRRSRT